MRKKAATVLALSLTLAVALGPGCILGSPVAAFSGEPYGMTRDDWKAIGGARQPIWGGHPVFAAMDLPFAFVLDTGFLPISLIIWGIKALGDDGDGDGDHGHDHGEGSDHSHDDEEVDDHEHGADDDEPAAPGPTARDDDLHSHGDGYQHRHEGGHLPHTHDE